MHFADGKSGEMSELAACTIGLIAQNFLHQMASASVHFAVQRVSKLLGKLECFSVLSPLETSG